MDKQKFFSSFLTTIVIILATFFVLTSDINIILGAAIIGGSVMTSEFLSERVFSKFNGQKISPPTVIMSYFLLFIIAFYFIELYS